MRPSSTSLGTNFKLLSHRSTEIFAELGKPFWPGVNHFLNVERDFKDVLEVFKILY